MKKLALTVAVLVAVAFIFGTKGADAMYRPFTE